MHTKGSKKSHNKPFKFLLQKYVPFSFVLWMQSRRHLFEEGREELPEQQVCSVPNTWAPRSILAAWFYFPLEDSAFQNRQNLNGFSLCVLLSFFFLSIILLMFAFCFRIHSHVCCLFPHYTALWRQQCVISYLIS